MAIVWAVRGLKAMPSTCVEDLCSKPIAGFAADDELDTLALNEPVVQFRAPFRAAWPRGLGERTRPFRRNKECAWQRRRAGDGDRLMMLARRRPDERNRLARAIDMTFKSTAMQRSSPRAGCPRLGSRPGDAACSPDVEAADFACSWNRRSRPRRPRHRRASG